MGPLRPARALAWSAARTRARAAVAPRRTAQPARTPPAVMDPTGTCTNDAPPAPCAQANINDTPLQSDAIVASPTLERSHCARIHAPGACAHTGGTPAPLLDASGLRSAR